MSARTSSPRTRWWHRLVGTASDRPHGLDDAWQVVEGPHPRTEVAVGPPGVFLLDHRRTRPRDVARHAGDLSGRLTAALGQCVTVHGVIVEEAVRPVRADQPDGVTVVTSIVLGPWLTSHPSAFDERQLRVLSRTVRSITAGVRTA